MGAAEWKRRLEERQARGIEMSENDETFVARRILYGLGLREKRLRDVQPYVAGESFYDSVMRLVRTCSNGRVGGAEGVPVSMIEGGLAKARELMPVVVQKLKENDGQTALMFGRDGGRAVCWLVTKVEYVDQLAYWMIKPPAHVVCELENYWLVAREASSVIKEMSRCDHWDAPSEIS